MNTRPPLPFTLWTVPTLHSGRNGPRFLAASSSSPGGAPGYAPVSGALDPIRSGDRRGSAPATLRDSEAVPGP